MAIRTIRTGIGTYQRPDGQWTHGGLGDEVDVNDADVERFDRLNGAVPEEAEAVTSAGDGAGEPDASAPADEPSPEKPTRGRAAK